MLSFGLANVSAFRRAEKVNPLGNILQENVFEDQVLPSIGSSLQLIMTAKASIVTIKRRIGAI
jgi:hypothetical protein